MCPGAAPRAMSGTMSAAYSRAAPAPLLVPSSHTSDQAAATSASSSRAATNAVGSAAAACPANASAAPRASSRSSRPPTRRAPRSPARRRRPRLSCQFGAEPLMYLQGRTKAGAKINSQKQPLLFCKVYTKTCTKCLPCGHERALPPAHRGSMHHDLRQAQRSHAATCSSRGRIPACARVGASQSLVHAIGQRRSSPACTGFHWNSPHFYGISGEITEWRG